MKTTSQVLAAVLAALLLMTPRPTEAANCFGGAARKAIIKQTRVIYLGTFTVPGGTHADLIAGGDFVLSLADVDDPDAAIVTVSIPAAQFSSTPKKTKYDGSGAFEGKVTLKDDKKQADTVVIKAIIPATLDPGALSPAGVRGEFSGGDECARSCVSSCETAASGKKVKCGKSALHEPFAEDGYGLLAKKKASDVVSPLCGQAGSATGPRCEPLIQDACLLPYPSSTFLDADVSTPTGLRMHYDLGSLPSNASGTPIDPTDWNTLDGFSPGPTILALFPDSGLPVDLDLSGAAFHTDFAGSLDPNHPTVIMRADDGERIVHFAEMDVQTDDVVRKALVVRPGKRLDDATRYLVAMRGLVDEAGDPVQPPLGFRALRDGYTEAEIAAACGAACAAELEARRATMEEVFTLLAANGVAREELQLAWDFTTASTEALTGWMVSIRDQAFALPTPGFTVTSVDDGGGAGFNTEIYARVEGTFAPPLFMTADAPASRLNLVAGVPTQNGVATVPFVVDIPRIAVASENAAATPARGSLWGHGLLGSRYQLGALSELADGFNFVIAAVDMQGMSSDDVGPGVIPLLTDFSLFHRIPERLHQGFLNHLLLGRLMADPVSGFNSHAAFQLGVAGAGVIDTSQVFYSGGSQGGIFGVAIMGVTDNFDRGFLAVPGANYSTLLQRSIDFDPFFVLLDLSYPDKLTQMQLFALIQQQWDRAEPQGYLPHVLAGTLSDPPKPRKVLLHMATYDSEVSNLSTEIMTRSLGVPQVTPVHRSFFDVPEMAAPFDGSAFVEIDPQLGFSRCLTPGGSDAGAACTTNADCPGAGDPPERTECASGIPPLTNEAPQFNNGAHGSTGVPAAGAQIAAFLSNTGTVEQFCTGTCDPE